MPEKKLKPLVIFASGGGSTAAALQVAIEAGQVNGQIVTIVCDEQDAGILSKKEFENVPKIVYNKMDSVREFYANYREGDVVPNIWENVPKEIQKISKRLWYRYVYNKLIIQDTYSKIDIYALGFTGKIPEYITRAFEYRIYNNHPAPMSKEMQGISCGKGMHGDKPYKSGLKFYQNNGITQAVWEFNIHHVTERFDDGAQIITLRFPIKSEADSKRLKEFTMILEKWATVFFAKTICNKDMKNAKLPELSEIISELRIASSQNELSVTADEFNDLIVDVLPETLISFNREQLDKDMDEIKNNARKYKENQEVNNEGRKEARII